MRALRGVLSFAVGAHRQGWSVWVLPALLSVGLLRTGYVLGSFVLTCPADRPRIVMFTMVAAIAAVGPGLFLRRWLRVRSSNLFLEIAFVLTSSLCGTALLVWVLYSVGIYTRPVLVGGLAIIAFGGLYGAVEIVCPISTIRARLNRFAPLSLFEGVALLVGLLFVQGIFERVVGTPMASWDALTSWDKWAVDAGMRKALGRYAMGGYPQFLPCLGSMFYKLGNSSADVFPIEHLLLHGFYVQFVAVLLFSLLALGRTLNIPGGVVLCLLMGNGLIFEMTTEQIGSVDVPFAAVLCSACSLGAAYVQGSWGSARRGWADATALFFPLFSLPFMKGNGLAWVVVLAMAMCCGLRRRREVRPVCIAFLATMGVALPYLLHQVWFGAVRPDLAEQDPFLRSHGFEPIHVRESVLSLAHSGKWAKRLGAAYGLATRSGGVCLAVGCLLLCLWAARDRKLRFFAIAGPLSLVVWFFTGSYDFRNAVAPWAMSLVAVTGALWDGNFVNSRRAFRAVMRGGLILLALASMKNILTLSRLPLPVGKTTAFPPRKAVTEFLLAMPFRTFMVPVIATAQGGQRHMCVRPLGDVREILFRAPFGKRAAHLLAADGLYRILAPRGVYMMQGNRYNHARRFDVALGEPYLRPPERYVPVSRFRRVPPYNFPVRLLTPEFEAVAMRTADLDDEDIRNVVLQSGGTRAIRFEYPDSRAAKLKEGILSLRISPADAPMSLCLSTEDAGRDPYSAYFESVRDGAYVRLLYWMNDDLPVLPRFVLRAGNRDIRIVSAEWGQ